MNVHFSFSDMVVGITNPNATAVSVEVAKTHRNLLQRTLGKEKLHKI